MSPGPFPTQACKARKPLPIAAGIEVALIALLLAWCVLRVVLVPRDGAITGGFEHDAAYIGIVAAQVRDGHGFINPASWLLFLNPPRLPMPFHNANPGYPALIAVVSGALDIDVVRAGLTISALCNGLLMAAVFLLVRHYADGWRIPLFCSVLVGLFPVNWADSFAMLPDALSTALTILAFVFAVRNRAWYAIPAGACLALAWLTRSSASTALLPVAWFIFRRNSIRNTVLWLIIFAVAFAVVISPWLVHTYKVWGSPFRSDASYYLFQDYYARAYGGALDRYWRSLTPPPPVGLADLPEFLPFYLRNLARMPYTVMRGVMGWTKLTAIATIMLAVIAGIRTRRCWRTPEFQAGALLMIVTVAIVAVRAPSVEIRYLGPPLVLFAIWLAMPWFPYVERSYPGRTDRPLRVVGIAAAICAAVVIVPQDVFIWRYATGILKDNLEYRDASRRIAGEIAGNNPVVIPKPYFYTFFTGRSALAPPLTDKTGLLAFMSRYSAPYLALPQTQIDYYYPEFKAFAPEIRPAGEAGFLQVFKRME